MKPTTTKKAPRSGAKRFGWIAGGSLLLAFAALFGMQPGPVKADLSQGNDRLALLAKPAVVRIVDAFVGEFYSASTGKTYKVADGGAGSGFFIGSDGFIETNAHVVEASHIGDDGGKKILVDKFINILARELNRPPESIVSDPQVMATSELRQFNHIHTVIIADGAKFPFDLRQFGTPVSTTSSEDAAVIKIEITNAPILKLGDSDRLRDQDHVTVVGYPSAQESAFIDEKSNLESSITDGKISARRTGADGKPLFQTTAPSTHGNSGGPVLNDAGEAVGLLTFGGGREGATEVSGFAFFVAESTAIPFVRRAGVNNDLGPADVAYRDGLEAFFHGHYRTALEKFQEVKRLSSHHSKIDGLIAEATQKAATTDEPAQPVVTPQPKTASRSGSGSGVALLAIVAIGGLVMLLVVVGGAAFAIKALASRKPEMRGASASSMSSFVLRGVSGSQAGMEISLDGQPVMIGRDPAMCQLVFPAGVSGISKTHCRLTFNPVSRSVMLEDCNSTNGTFLQSGDPVRPGTPRMLGVGDRFYLSDPRNMFEIAAARSGKPPAAAAATVPAKYQAATAPMSAAFAPALANAGYSSVPQQPSVGLRAVMVGIKGEYAGRSIDMDSGNLVIGRDAGACQVVFPTFMEEVSKRHCMIRFSRSRQRFVIADLRSSNGTFVVSNGRETQVDPGSSRELNPGDRFFLGDNSIMFEVRLER